MSEDSGAGAPFGRSTDRGDPAIARSIPFSADTIAVRRAVFVSGKETPEVAPEQTAAEEKDALGVTATKTKETGVETTEEAKETPEVGPKETARESKKTNGETREQA